MFLGRLIRSNQNDIEIFSLFLFFSNNKHLDSDITFTGNGKNSDTKYDFNTGNKFDFVFYPHLFSMRKCIQKRN